MEWNGANLRFARNGVGWTQEFSGVVQGRIVSGTFTDSADISRRYDWSGSRAQVLTYGLYQKVLKIVNVGSSTLEANSVI